MKKLKKMLKKIVQTNKTIKKCIQNNIKNFKTMTKNLKRIWLMMLFFCCLTVAGTGCNVTRTISNEATSITRGDTTIIIKTTTKEIYDATKKGATL